MIVALVLITLSAAALITDGAAIGDETIDYRRLGPNGAGGRGLKLLFLLSRLFGREPNGFSVGFGVGLGAEFDEIEADTTLGPFAFTLDPPENTKKKNKNN